MESLSAHFSGLSTVWADSVNSASGSLRGLAGNVPREQLLGKIFFLLKTDGQGEKKAPKLAFSLSFVGTEMSQSS